jgi:hypothetical protein
MSLFLVLEKDEGRTQPKAAEKDTFVELIAHEVLAEETPIPPWLPRPINYRLLPDTSLILPGS